MTGEKFSFREVDFFSDVDCHLLARWFNQDVATLSASGRAGETAESIRKGFARPAEATGPAFEAFFVCVGAQPVGYASFLIDPPHKLSANCVAWPSLAIGEPAYRRQGLAQRLAEEISRRARKCGATHFEAGVFKSNLPMIRLLEKLGFERIAESPAGSAKIPSLRFVRPLF